MARTSINQDKMLIYAQMIQRYSDFKKYGNSKYKVPLKYCFKKEVVNSLIHFVKNYYLYDMGIKQYKVSQKTYSNYKLTEEGIYQREK